MQLVEGEQKDGWVEVGIVTIRSVEICLVDAEEVTSHLVSDQLTNGLNFLNKEDNCTFCFPQERALPN